MSVYFPTVGHVQCVYVCSWAAVAVWQCVWGTSSMLSSFVEVVFLVARCSAAVAPLACKCFLVSLFCRCLGSRYLGYSAVADVGLPGIK